MKKSIQNFGVFCLISIVLFSSCVSSTLIQSTPSGAKVYINGESVGNTPYIHRDSRIVGTITNIDLVKEGYNTLYTSIERAEQINPEAILGGLFFAVPFLWMMDYKPTHTYELVPIEYNRPVINSNTEPMHIESEKTIKNQTDLQQQSTTANPTKLERLKELKQLLDAELITKEDFENQKQRILSEL